MLPERAIRLTEAAYIEPARQFFAPRMLALLNQVMELRREHAQRTGKPLDMEPTTQAGAYASPSVSLPLRFSAQS
jgi:hypothetical protein